MELLTFYLFAVAAVLSAALVVLQRRAVYSALALIVCLGSVAVLFFQLGAHFMSAVQVIVYAGAIMVLFLFVVMLLDPESEIFGPSRLKSAWLLGVPSALLLVFLLVKAFPAFQTTTIPAVTGAAMQDTALLAKRLFRDYLLPFEVTSILVLIAVMGAVVLTKRPK